MMRGVSADPEARLSNQPTPILSRAAQLLSVDGIGSRRDYALTLGTEFGVLASSLIVLRLAASYWGADAFGEYVLARRTITTLSLATSLSTALAVTRYIAAAGRRSARYEQRAYLLGGILIVSVSCAITLSLFTLFAKPVTAALFGAADLVPLSRSVALAIVGLVLHGVAYGTLRGLLSMRRANALQFVNLGAIPLACFSWPGLSPSSLIRLLGLSWCLTSIAALLLVTRRPKGQPVGGNYTMPAARELLVYGTLRLPAEVALGALFGLPVTLAAHFGGVVEAGQVGVAVSILSSVGAVFAPLGNIILPSLSGVVNSSGRTRVRVAMGRLLVICLAVTALLVGALEALARPVVLLIGGPGLAPAVPFVRVVLLGAVPYVVYVVLRNVLDALHVRPLNAKNLAGGLLTFLVAAASTGSASSIPVCLVLGMVVLGCLSMWDAHSVLHGDLRLRRRADITGLAQTSADPESMRAEGD
jgi:O-antigen/teichoic acid export membrane protein